MKAIRLLTAALALVGGAASGQSGPTEKGTGHELAGRWGKNYTPGWSMMTAKERSEHKRKIGKITNYDECKALIEQVRTQTGERAKSKGMSPPPAPAKDACAGLKR